MKIFGYIIIILIILASIYIYNINLPIPFDPLKKEKEIIEIAKFISSEYNIPYKISYSIVKISYLEMMDPFLIISLIYTESAFRPHARSKLGYYGLMQVKPEIKCIETNVFYGIKILKEKIRIYNDLDVAIIKYKGYNVNSDKGWKEKEKVFLFYSKIKEKYNLWRNNEKE